ncbi:Dynein regulatory complex protein 9 [Frankliniella fusca]|uniref:Dynein regulatory complex protein 9 n=1 Tax=Frankliniella fusca TaxID=407009 RepID=A0AAE1HU64_9NEOP|nr:Dynein regulatory complex protein 9 [Frankliniella fusca]
MEKSQEGGARPRPAAGAGSATQPQEARRRPMSGRRQQQQQQPQRGLVPTRGGASSTSSHLWEPGQTLGAVFGSALRTLSFERISEVDEEEEERSGIAETSKSTRTSISSRSSRSSSSSVYSPPSSVRSSAGPGDLTSSGTSVPLDEDAADNSSAAEDDATLADLSTVSSLSDGTVDGDSYWQQDELQRLVDDVVGEDEDLIAHGPAYRAGGANNGDLHWTADETCEVVEEDAPQSSGPEAVVDDDLDDDVVFPPSGSTASLVDDPESQLEALALGCVLEDAVDQLCILAYTSRAAKLGPDLASHSLNERLLTHETIFERAKSERQLSPRLRAPGVGWQDLYSVAYLSTTTVINCDPVLTGLGGVGGRLEAADAREAESRSSVIPAAGRGPDVQALQEDNARVDKIQRDRALVQEALRLQQHWLRGPGAVGRRWSRGGGGAEALLDSPLCRLVREEERRVAEEAVMLVDSARGAGRADSLRSKVQAEEQRARVQLRALRDERAQLQEEARSLRARAALGAAVTDRWERARLQQHQRLLRDQEHVLQAGLQAAREDLQLELRAHCELVEYLRQAARALADQADEWSARYDEVAAGWEARLAALKLQRQEHGRQLRAARKELARRERFKRDFLAYKAARDQQLEERARMHTAATRIQSWWRMTMVRKGLGPYKRIAKKKKKKKK